MRIAPRVGLVALLGLSLLLMGSPQARAQSVGQGACETGTDACTGNTGNLGPNSCNEDFACEGTRSVLHLLTPLALVTVRETCHKGRNTSTLVWSLRRKRSKLPWVRFHRLGRADRPSWLSSNFIGHVQAPAWDSPRCMGLLSRRKEGQKPTLTRGLSGSSGRATSRHTAG